jgi:hypothetical protein
MVDLFSPTRILHHCLPRGQSPVGVTDETARVIGPNGFMHWNGRRRRPQILGAERRRA